MPIITLQPDGTTGIDGGVNGGNPTSNYATAAQITVDQSGPNRLLIKFDLSGEAIQAGDTINSATLYLRNINTRTGDRFFSVYRILQSWAEACTWNFADGATTRWLGDTGADGGADAGCSVAGTDHGSAAMGTFTYLANDPAGTEYAIPLDVADVAAWLSNNYGLIVRMDTVLSSILFATSDHATATYRPRLVIDYTAGGTTHDLTATDITTGAPDLDAPAADVQTYTDGTTGDVFTADDVVLNSVAPTFNLGAHANFELSSLQNSLLRFNLSGITGTVYKATLHLYKSYPMGEGGGTIQARVYPVLAANAAWTGGATDNQQAAAGEPCWNALAADGSGGITTPWAGGANGCGVAGTDHGTTVIGAADWTPLDDVIGQEYTIDLDPATVETWLGPSNSNYGIVIKTEGGGSDHVGQADSLTAAYRPKLVVLYNPELAGGLVIHDATHAHTADALTLAHKQALQIDGASHAHTAEQPALTQKHTLVIHDATHGHTAEGANLGAILVIANAQHGHSAENLTLTQRHSLVIQDAIHGHRADSLGGEPPRRRTRRRGRLLPI